MPYFQSVLIKQFYIWNQCISFSCCVGIFHFRHSLLHFRRSLLHFRHSLLLLYFRLSLLFHLQCSLLLYFRRPRLCRFQLSISHFQCSLLHIYNFIFVILWQTDQVRSAKDLFLFWVVLIILSTSESFSLCFMWSIFSNFNIVMSMFLTKNVNIHIGVSLSQLEVSGGMAERNWYLYYEVQLVVVKQWNKH